MKKIIRLIFVISFMFMLIFSCKGLCCPKPKEANLSKNSGFNNEVVIVNILGGKFHKSTYVKLVKDNKYIDADIMYLSEDEIVCEFNLIGKEHGTYDLIVANVGTITKKDKVLYVEDSFEVIEYIEPVIEPEIVVAPDPEIVVAPDPEIVEEHEIIEEVIIEQYNNEFLSPVYFDFDSSCIKDDQLMQLIKNIEYIQSNNMYIVLGGNADERGERDYNYSLSLRRANEVKNLLIANGVDEDRITVYSYGEDFPIKLGHDEESWKYNRRVDISVWNNVPDYGTAVPAM